MTSALRLISKNLTTKVCIGKTLPIFNHLHHVQFSEASSRSADPSEESVLPPELEEVVISEEEIMRKRDISRLTPKHRAIVHNAPLPFEPSPRSKLHNRVSKQRHLYGKYGSSIGINPAVCFMTKEEIEDQQEYEKVTYTEHILEIRKRKLEELAEEKRQYRIREEQYEKVLATMEEHKQRIRDKILKKLGEAEAAKKKRDALLEEVKRHFGYTIDPKDEKFQLMLEQKEKEQKKLQKELKKKKREEFFLAKLASLESGQEKSPADNSSKENKKNENDDEDDDDDENAKEK